MRTITKRAGFLALAASTALLGCARTEEATVRVEDNRTTTSTTSTTTTATTATTLAMGATGTLGTTMENAGNAIEGAANATGNAIEGAAKTIDVKAALIANGSVDASHVDVDTNDAAKTVTLKGSVPTADQKAAAERIAKENAPEYTVVNQLTVGAAH